MPAVDREPGAIGVVDTGLSVTAHQMAGNRRNSRMVLSNLTTHNYNRHYSVCSLNTEYGIRNTEYGVRNTEYTDI